VGLLSKHQLYCFFIHKIAPSLLEVTFAGRDGSVVLHFHAIVEYYL
jgi:hypothetical protein